MPKQMITDIKSCADCPYKCIELNWDRVCKHPAIVSRDRGETRELPLIDGKVHRYDYVIPDWCPLEDTMIVDVSSLQGLLRALRNEDGKGFLSDQEAAEWIREATGTL